MTFGPVPEQAATWCANCNVLLTAAMDKTGRADLCDASPEVRIMESRNADSKTFCTSNPRCLSVSSAISEPKQRCASCNVKARSTCTGVLTWCKAQPGQKSPPLPTNCAGSRGDVVRHGRGRLFRHGKPRSRWTRPRWRVCPFRAR